MRLGLGSVLRLLLVVGIVAGLLWVRHATDRAVDAISLVVNGTTRPPLPADTSAQRLLPAAFGPAGQGGYTFAETQGAAGAPVTYDPCRPIHVVVSLEAAPANALAVVQSALATVQADTGLELIVDGTTTELAQPKRPFVDRARYGNRWAPVLLAFTTPERVPALHGDVAGIGGSARFSDGGPAAYVTGIVYLDGPTFQDLERNGAGGQAEEQAIVLHELGHLVGLAHNESPGQLMNAENDGRTTTFGAGDLRGLALLGQGGCQRGF